MFRNIGLLAVLCLLLFVSGCEDAEKIQMAADLEERQATIESLRHQLELKTADYNHSQDAYYAERQATDSLGKVIADKDQAIASTSAKLTKAKAKSENLQSALDSLTPAHEQLLKVHESLSQEVADLQALQEATEHVRDSLHAVAVSRDSLITEIKPWYTMYRYNATKRNWFEKLWGADKKNPPEFPEPMF